MNHVIHPPAYKPTELEHRAAYLKWCLQDIVWENLLFIDMCRRGMFDNHPSLKTDPKVLAEERLQELLGGLFPVEDKDGEPWERRFPFEKFKVAHEGYLAEAHCGDCVAVACACARCQTEDLYKVPFTATWDKYEGNALYHQYRQTIKKDKANV